jgi:predicted amidohydrolase
LTDGSINGEGVRATVRAAAVQLNATADKDRNLATADALVREAAARGAELVVLPEKWPAIGPGEALRDGAEALDGPAVRWARAIAAELGIDLVAGSLSLHDPAAGAGVISNASPHVSPGGEIVALYRKLHMFDVDVDGTAYRESDHERAGDALVLSRTAGGVELGLTICYDLRFPELFRELAARGARAFAVPAAFTWATTRDHWEILVRARAIENQAFVVAANQIGEHAPGLRSGGRSMIVDPWGIVLAQAPDTETVIVADLDLDRQARIRRDLPSLANRRPRSLYAEAGA